jgi:hypothetical protein
MSISSADGEFWQNMPRERRSVMQNGEPAVMPRLADRVAAASMRR